MRQWVSVLLALGRAIAWASLTHGGFAVLTLGLCVCGRRHRAPLGFGLAALAPTQTGKGSGVLNSCSFLGGAVGVAGGGIRFGVAGFEGLLMLVGLSALPLPQSGRPKKVPLTPPTTPQILVGFAAVGDPISPHASDRMHIARPP
jgi:hypothetical protein